ncbi:MAG TPA: VWA domain-containing protein, partial [Myxococcota bacterium]|nr:VWA domain-containing protein [Myxococcota bacterium]
MDWEVLHFLRPLWLLLLPLVIVAYFFRIDGLHSVWARVVEPHLLPHVLCSKNPRPKARFKTFFLPAVLFLLILSLAGPTMKKMPTDVSYNRAPLILCLEVSESMLLRDIEPSRLKRAIYKIEDLLRLYRGAQVALIAFAGDAHLVVPLTDDYNTLLSLAKSLSPDLMPIKGVNTGSALEMAAQITMAN